MCKKLKRRFYHLFKSGCFVIGLEHFLVMFPSAMLIARLANTVWGTVIELPAVLFACGIGTMLFCLILKKRIPFFLGPSFSYIGFVSYQVAQISSSNDIVAIRSTIYYGYIIGGVILFIISWLYRFGWMKRFLKTLFPSTIMGPAISLIGLELANMASEDSGFNGDDWQLTVLAIVTLACIIVFSLLRHHFFHNASILIGVLIGCVIASFMGQVDWPAIQKVKIVLPEFYISNITSFPNHWITLTLSVFPCAMIAFVESLGRISVYEGMLRRDEKLFDEGLSNSALSLHSGINMLTSITNMMPSAIYAENLAIMNLHSADLSTKYKINEEEDLFVNNCYSTYSIYPYIIASLVSIVVALFSGLQDIFLSIPMPILGGMELFVFGLISAPGIQMLVEQQVNYKKISNQIITATVFLAGISNISITYGSLSLRGMSLGLAIGVIVNIITLILGYLGYLNEEFTINEIIEECIDVLDEKITLFVYSDTFPMLKKEVNAKELKANIYSTKMVRLIKNSQRVELLEHRSSKSIAILQDNGRIKLRVSLPKPFSTMLINDNQRMTIYQDKNRVAIIAIDEYVSKRILRDILKHAN